MSALENMLTVSREKKLEVAAAKAAPEDYRRGHEIKGDEGTAATGPLTDDEVGSLSDRDMLERAGLDPEIWEISSAVQSREWDAAVGGGEVRRMHYRRFDVRKRGAKAVGLDDLVKLLEGKPGIKPPVMRGVQDMVDHVFHYATGDFQMGKALSDDTPVFTTEGWKRHGDIIPGDKVFSPEGKPVTVLAVTGSTEQDLYEVKFDKGQSIIASGDHLWKGMRRRYSKPAGGYVWEEGVYSTSELAAFPSAPQKNGKLRANRALNIPASRPLELPESDLPIDPYVLGVWLGDGNSHSGLVTKGYDDAEWLLSMGYQIVPNGNALTVRIPGLSDDLKRAGLLRNKHIPSDYLTGSYDQRVALVQGLMDTDGYCSGRGQMEFCNTNQNIIEGMEFLLSSLGVKFKKKGGVGKLNGEEKKPFWKLSFSVTDYFEPFRAPRKLANVRPAEGWPDRARRWQVQEVAPAGRGMAQCLTVEGHMYLAGDALIPTHNCDGDGTEGIIERIVKSTKAAVNEYVLYFQPRGVKHVHISFLGDCIEGVVSQGGRNVTRNDLTLTEQILLVQRIMLLSIDAFVDAGAEKITVVSIPGNHDETSRQFGTRYDDSFATHALVTVADAMRMNAERYSHVETFIPKKDKLTVTMKVGDTIITHAHGHQWRPAQHWKWWQGNSFEKGADIGQADLLLCGHSHHFQVDTQGSRTFIMTPSQESESTWYKNATGTHGAPGAVIFTTKGGSARNLSVV